MAVSRQKVPVDWEKEFEEYRSSGKSMRSFCSGRNYSFGSFSYHYSKYKAFAETEEQVSFCPVVVVDPEENRTVRINGLDIRIDEDTSEQSLRKVLSVLRSM